MFETDFPHATSLSAGPTSESPSPPDVMDRSLDGVDEENAGKVLQHTATKLYHLEPPSRNWHPGGDGARPADRARNHQERMRPSHQDGGDA